MDDQAHNRESSVSGRLAIWKGLAMVLATLLISAFAVANIVLGLRFREWPGGAQFFFIVGVATLCVAVARYLSKRSSLGMD
jgi:hypothetical protein